MKRESISIQTPAKLNLYLEVLGKRPDGFHELATVITAIDRFDQLTISRQAGNRVDLSCRWDPELELQTDPDSHPLGDLPVGPENLIYRATELFLTRTGIQSGVRLELCKTIPSRAGLGGASGNAAGTLLALNTLFETGRSLETLSGWAAELGSDVPFFISGGAACCRGRGEQVKPFSLSHRLDFVVVKPEQGLSTGEIFSKLQLSEEVHPGVGEMKAPETIDWKRKMFNRLQKPAEQVCHEIETACELLRESGCPTSLMTGSGSCCFGICHNRQHAREVACRISDKWPGFVFTCRNLEKIPVPD